MTGIWVGVDVSKRWLDIELGATGKRFRVANDAEGHAALLMRLEGVSVAGLVMEGSGGGARPRAGRGRTRGSATRTRR